ncbi:MAG TPA: ABC transporter ATP-binding protein, partial [Candidatus Limnocylindria bacterium]|nr:ABC transporter ATP-binding protein [Candidatus Limnocylindria bacterium]
MTSATQTSGTPAPAQPGGGMRVRLSDVRVSFPAPDGRLTALDGLNLDIPAGSFTAVIGPNGCGKSTLLRAVAGLLVPAVGTVMLGDGTAAPRAGDGRVGLAFQQPRLVPWLTTVDNVALPLALRGSVPAERRERALGALERVGLGGAAHLRPAQLSGGMAQRAALARSLIGDPPVLLLDEPFSALDALTREAFDTELQALWQEQRRTIILVTHSVPEAVRLADRVVVMTARPGRVASLVEVQAPHPRPVAPTHPGVAAADRAVRDALSDV